MRISIRLENFMVMTVLLIGVLLGACQAQGVEQQASSKVQSEEAPVAASLVSSDQTPVPGEISLSGVVTDASGNPVRGAMVKAVLGTKTVARFTDESGRYQIKGLEPGQYDVIVDASGFALAKQQLTDPAQKGDTNFKLSAGVDLSRLNSSEMAYLLPDTEEGHQVFLECSGCHGFESIMSMAGMPETAWAGFLSYMTINRWGALVGYAPEQAVNAAPRIAKIFGPEGVLGPNGKPDYSKIKYTPLQDAALKATITEYTVPSPGAMVHSVTVDDSNGIVWFSEYDAASNALARFDPETETFQEFPNPLPKAQGHTGTVLKDGRFIVGLDRGSHDEGEVATKMAIVGDDGKVEALDFPGMPSGARMVIEDPTKENVVWVVIGAQTWRYNVKTKELKTYHNPVPETFPEGSYAGRFARPGDKPSGNGYALAVDSKGTPWVTQINLGNILRLDPDTGEWKIYHTPEMASARGIDVDAEDNVWFGDYYGHKLGMLDPKTGDVKFYYPPNPKAAPYGITVDRKRGYVWYGDTTANNATRFNPKTGEFVEYPLPTADTAVRFMGIDPQGRAWYGGFFNQKLGVVDPGDDTSVSVSLQ